MVFQHRSFYRLFCGLALCLFLGGMAPSAQAQNRVAIDQQAINTYLEKQIQSNHIPGLAVAVVQGDQVLFTRGYGKAGADRPMTPQTQLYIGSLTKSFTAMAIMQLVEQGKIDLDAPVQRYLPWFQVADAWETKFPEASAKITVRNLLNQTSGLSEASYPDSNEYAATLEEQVRSMQKASLTAPVGSTFQYFNQNYQVLGLIIQQVSGKSYADYLDTSVLKPLGMDRTFAEPQKAVDLAQGYSQAFGFPLPQTQPFRPAGLPSGYLVTSAEDISHYLIAQLNQGRYQDRQLVTPESIRQMRTPPAGVETQYGMGWMVLQDSEFGQVIYHNGGLENFYAEIFILPDQNLAFAALFNQGGLVRQMTGNPVITSGLADLLVGKQPTAPSYAWIGWVMLGLMALDMANHLRLFITLPKWLDKTARLPRKKQWLRSLPGLVISLVLLLGLPLLGSALLSAGSISWLGFWKNVYAILPDLAIWMLVGFSLNLLLSSIQVFLISRSKAAPVQ